jgi:hypothetical protein
MMHLSAIKTQPARTRLDLKPHIEKFYCAEFSLGKQKCLYQFKLWKNPFRSVFIVVPENSAVLKRLETGSIVPMAFYSGEKRCSTECHPTRIQQISKAETGPFSGNYLVDLALVASRNLKLVP